MSLKFILENQKHQSASAPRENKLFIIKSFLKLNVLKSYRLNL